MALRDKKNSENSIEAFWKEYEEKNGEKVISRGMGKYVSGFDEFDRKQWNEIWGLLVTTSGGFRFHHYPQNNWFDAIVRRSQIEQPKEKEFFIPKERIITKEFLAETKWWKKLFSSAQPQLVIRYTDEEGNGKCLLLETDYKG